ncbi:hypothetical protein DSO57_1025456 [Entomophthora muscae]|uniref:Uncharacterized protein n=1 Tax=Entomophthora muscae TaxID=34485 RepID=A0ACC2UBF9_9FUNG|nr:hypothetical protein DSO57_1025456 [Entomophthora muscae]
MEVQDLVAYFNHQQEYQAALDYHLDLSFAETTQHLNALLEKLNTQLPSIVDKILDLRGGSQPWCRNVTCHILAVEHYIEDATCRRSSHQEETGCCASELVDVRSKLETLAKEFEDSHQANQSELNIIKDLVSAAGAKIVKLKDSFLKYDDHLKVVLEESSAALCKEIGEKLLLTSQTLNTANVVPEMEDVCFHIDSLTILNNDVFLEINKVNVKHDQ